MPRRLFPLIGRIAQDLRYGGFTGGIKPSPYEHLGANDTVSTNYALLKPLLDANLRQGDHFVDVGCGTGRVLNWVLADSRASRVYGLELDEEVATAVSKRLQNQPKVEIRQGSAVETLPADGTLFYMWNPFRGDVMRAFRDALLAKTGSGDHREPVRVVYHNCLHRDVWDEHEACEVEDIALPKFAEHRAIRVIVHRTDR
jgi:SAM-dependent methyltransferase